MAQIVTITNPLTGQPAQVDQLDHTAQGIDDAIARALPGGEIDITLQNKLGGIESADYPGCYYRMVGSVVEWFNPPMVLGKEYRTTERYLGKPVYTKLVNFGALPNSTTARVAHGVENIGYRIFVGGDANGEPLVTRSGISYITAGSSDIVIATSSNLSAITAHVLLKYTKSTD